jgi:hypothetical protein
VYWKSVKVGIMGFYGGGGIALGRLICLPISERLIVNPVILMAVGVLCTSCAMMATK